ncbi:hypothetical protein Moror_6986 [Moniliophthora roreri MCA 2997]|uniref:Uncharacterized protein n=1 Tax=Moniliophthora roreri (strain MCA 2997) TaxID=1381753 RepID=V2XBA6_MONRO|nr:hypothetical protein Moror_6986 [Moniliophthora roreri MCA 2997]
MCLTHDTTTHTTATVDTVPVLAAPVQPPDNTRVTPTSSSKRTLHKKKSSGDLRDDFYRAAAAELEEQSGKEHERVRTKSGSKKGYYDRLIDADVNAR